jgi:hypothetical protein
MVSDGYHRDVSNLPFPSQPPGPPPWSPPPGTPRRSPILLVIASLAIAFTALGVAIGSWFRPTPTNKPAPGPAYTSQQITDSKSKLCAAFSKVHNAIQVTSTRDRGPDYATQLASAVNARQALLAGSQYLLTTLSSEPATPADLTTQVRNLANTYQLLTVQLLAEAPDSDINTLVHSGDETTSTLENLCK